MIHRKKYPYDDYMLFVYASPKSEYWSVLTKYYGMWDSKLDQSPQIIFLTKNST